MSYIALHYVKIKNRMYLPAEIIEELDGAVAERLLAKGAIREEGSPAVASVQEEAQETPRPVKPAAVRKAVKEKPLEAPAAIEEDEADDSAVIPEINALDGIIGSKKRTRKK